MTDHRHVIWTVAAAGDDDVHDGDHLQHPRAVLLRGARTQRGGQHASGQ